VIACKKKQKDVVITTGAEKGRTVTVVYVTNPN